MKTSMIQKFAFGVGCLVLAASANANHGVPVTRTVSATPNPALQNEWVTLSFSSEPGTTHQGATVTDTGSVVRYQIAKNRVSAPGNSGDAGYDTFHTALPLVVGTNSNFSFKPESFLIVKDDTTEERQFVYVEPPIDNTGQAVANYNCYNVRAAVGDGNSNTTPAVPLCLSPPTGNEEEDDCAGKPDLSIAATRALGPGVVLNNTTGEWGYGITVKACTEIMEGAKVQGGNAAWVNPVVCDVDVESNVSADSLPAPVCHYKKKNTVITWTLPAMLKGDVYTLTSKGTGTAKVAVRPGVLPLNGPWSVVYQTVADTQTNPVTPPHKTDYTGRVEIEVVDTLSE